MKNIVFITIFLIQASGFCLNAQSAQEKARKVLSVFDQKEYLLVEAHISMYEYGSAQVKDTLSFAYQKNKQQEYFRLGGLEILNTGTKVLVADHDERIVSITKGVAETPMDNFFDPNAISDFVKSPQAIITEAPTGDDMGGLSITSPSAPEKRYFIKYNKKTYQLREIQITGPDPLPDDPDKDPPIITLISRYHLIESVKRAFLHSPDNFVIFKNGKYSGSGKCKGYEILSD